MPGLGCWEAQGISESWGEGGTGKQADLRSAEPEQDRPTFFS